LRSSSNGVLLLDALVVVMAVLGMEKPLAMVSTDHMMARESSADIRCVDVMMIDYCLLLNRTRLHFASQ